MDSELLQKLDEMNEEDFFKANGHEKRARRIRISE